MDIEKINRLQGQMARMAPTLVNFTEALQALGGIVGEVVANLNALAGGIELVELRNKIADAQIELDDLNEGGDLEERLAAASRLANLTAALHGRELPPGVEG